MRIPCVRLVVFGVAVAIAWVSLALFPCAAMGTSELQVLRIPFVCRYYPPLPHAPVLLPIDNEDGDGSYTINWMAATLAQTYELQESWQGGAWYIVYAGPSTSGTVANRPPGYYAYRCRSVNPFGPSPWSDPRSVTVVGQPPGTISTPSSTAVNANGKAVVRVVNDSPYVLRLEFTGPTPQSHELPSCGTCKVYSFVGPLYCQISGRPIQEFQTEPGPYRVFVSTGSATVRPYVGHWQLLGNRRYVVCFYVVRSGFGPAQVVVGSCATD